MSAYGDRQIESVTARIPGISSEYGPHDMGSPTNYYANTRVPASNESARYVADGDYVRSQSENFKYDKPVSNNTVTQYDSVGAVSNSSMQIRMPSYQHNPDPMSKSYISKSQQPWNYNGINLNDNPFADKISWVQDKNTGELIQNVQRTIIIA